MSAEDTRDSSTQDGTGDIRDWPVRSAEGGLLVTQKGAAAAVVFNRPERLNALTLDDTHSLLTVLRELSADPTVRAVALTGAGRGFSAGADLEGAFTPDALAAMPAHLREITTPTLTLIREMPKPVVAAVNGVAAGIGCSFALACDLVVARRSARLTMAFSKIGLSLDGGSSATLVARAGFGTAAWMAMTGRPVSAEMALGRGLVDEVLESEEYDSGVSRLLSDLAAGPTRSFAATKRLLNASGYPRLREALEAEAEIVEDMFATNDFRGAIQAVVAGRPVSFQGD
ncbi:enoyl-CoA hydratase/isomerase family protein [Pseudonocardia xishanensis]|uniref:2-(1,2-epoxy-1,2-dihydrophenyl)acetyl-CoA isomerase PaaG n=1 Tax=Pseudonocardia xishanensis TaxID=630995 RepID=A0ABP8S090_9PSEU